MRVVIVLIVLAAGTVFSFPYLQGVFPQLQLLVERFTASHQQPVPSETLLAQAPALEEPAQAPKKKTVYQWKDDNGQLKFTETPPPDGREHKEMVLESEEPSTASQKEKKDRVADYKKASKSYRTSSYHSAKSRVSGSSSNDRCRSINRQIKQREQRLSSRSHRANSYDRTNTELRDLKYKKIKEC